MANDLKYYQQLAEKMIDSDRQRDMAFIEYEQMAHNIWELPSPIRDLQWIRKVVSTDPHDAVATGTRVLSTLDPKISYQPLADNVETKERANDVERNLNWQLDSVNSRRQATVVRDIVRSALLYDEVIAQVVDLDYQIKQLEMFKGDTKRLKAARRYGRFLINVYNPRDVHVRRSSVMPEAVLLCVKKKAQSVIDEWGEYASSLESIAKTGDNVTLFDYMDYDVRVVWAVPDTTSASSSQDNYSDKDPYSDKEHLILPKDKWKHKMPFLPWVAMIGGSTLEHDERHKRRPLLYSIRESGQWETQNIVKTLYTSEVIAHAAAPRGKEEGPTARSSTNVDYMNPNRPIKVTPGNEYTPIPPPAIDQALSEIDDRISMSIDKSTVSRVLQGGEIPAGTAFATLNLATQTAVGTLKPAKALAEKSVAETLTMMMLWTHYTNKPLMAYGSEKRLDYGKQYIVQPEEIDPEAIYISVELTPDVPTDRQQRVNAASIAVQALDYPVEYALEDIGVTDPTGAMKQRTLERMVQNDMQLIMRQKQIQQDMMMQQQMAQQQAAMQQQQQQQANAQAAQQQFVQSQMGPQGIQGIGGQGFNPAEGGVPPATAAPEATREEQSGTDKQGAAINALGSLFE